MNKHYFYFPLCLRVTHRDTGSLVFLWGRRCDNFAVLKFHIGRQVAMGVNWNVTLCLSLCKHFWTQKKFLSSTSVLEFPDAHRSNCLQTALLMRWLPHLTSKPNAAGRLRLKCDGTRAETRFPLSAKRMSPFISAVGRQFSRLLVAEVCASAVVMLDTACSELVWRVLATHCIRHFPPSLPLLSVTVCQHISTGLYTYFSDEGSVCFEL
jgi:hypothetical protein